MIQNNNKIGLKNIILIIALVFPISGIVYGQNKYQKYYDL